MHIRHLIAHNRLFFIQSGEWLFGLNP